MGEDMGGTIMDGVILVSCILLIMIGLVFKKDNRNNHAKLKERSPN